MWIYFRGQTRQGGRLEWTRCWKSTSVEESRTNECQRPLSTVVSLSLTWGLIERRSFRCVDRQWLREHQRGGVVGTNAAEWWTSRHPVIGERSTAPHSPIEHRFSLDTSLRQPDYGVVFASRCLAATWDYTTALGGKCITDFRATSLSEESDSVLIMAEDGQTLRGRSVVLRCSDRF